MKFVKYFCAGVTLSIILTSCSGGVVIIPVWVFILILACWLTS